MICICSKNGRKIYICTSNSAEPDVFTSLSIILKSIMPRTYSSHPFPPNSQLFHIKAIGLSEVKHMLPTPMKSATKFFIAGCSCTTELCSILGQRFCLSLSAYMSNKAQQSLWLVSFTLISKRQEFNAITLTHKAQAILFFSITPGLWCLWDHWDVDGLNILHLKLGIIALKC